MNAFIAYLSIVWVFAMGCFAAWSAMEASTLGGAVTRFLIAIIACLLSLGMLWARVSS